MSTFSNHVETFYEALAENELISATQAWLEMKESVEDHNDNEEELQVQQEILVSCTAKIMQKTSACLESLKKACVDKKDIMALEFLAMGEVLHIGMECATEIESFLECKLKTTCQKAISQVKDHIASHGMEGYIDRQIHIDAIRTIISTTLQLMDTIGEFTQNEDMLQIILIPLHTHCMEYSLMMIDMYTNEARLSTWEKKARKSAQVNTTSSSSNGVDSEEKTQMIDLILFELCSLNHLCIHYLSYTNTLSSLKDTSSVLFYDKNIELNSVYVLLERFYLFQTVHKGIVITTPQKMDEPGQYFASFVGDIFFIINKVFHRAAQRYVSCITRQQIITYMYYSLSYTTTLTIVIAIIDTLESVYLPAVLNIPNRDFSMMHLIILPDRRSSITTNTMDNDTTHESLSSFSDALRLAVDDTLHESVEKEAKLIVAINSAQCSVQHLTELSKLITDCCTTTFPTYGCILESVPKPISEVTADFNTVVSNGVHALLDIKLTGHLGNIIEETLRDLIYEINATDYNQLQVHGSYFTRMIDILLKHENLQRARRSLGTESFLLLMQYFTRTFAAHVEKVITRKSVNAWGALQWETEIQVAITIFSNLVPSGSIRSEFKRLEQVLLSLVVSCNLYRTNAV